MGSIRRLSWTEIFYSKLDWHGEMTPIDELTTEQIGERLRVAREAAKWKQSDVAAKLDIARTTLVAIEQGQRRGRIGEIRQLAKLYGISVNALLRTEAVHADLAPKFRQKYGKDNEGAEEAAKLLTQLA